MSEEKSKINYENYIHIPAFMVKDLKLKGNELLVYAIIHGFSQVQGNNFYLDVDYMAEFTNSTRQGIFKNLKSLLEKNLIVKENISFMGVNKVYYRVNKVYNGSKQSLQDSKQSLQSESTKFTDNNIYNNNDLIINNKKDNKRDNKDNIYITENPKPKEEKIKYGEYMNVLLTETEYNKLADNFGIETRNKAIKFLDEYIEEKGYKSKSHNLAIRRWVIDAINKNKNNNNNQTKNRFDKLDEID